MNSSQQQGPAAKNAGSRTYLIVGIVSLTLMALVWSLEDSLVYIFSGIGVYFLFLYYWTSPRAKRFSSGTHGSRDDLYENLKRTFQSREKKSRVSFQHPQSESRKIIPAVAGFVFFVLFAIIFFAVIFSDDTIPENEPWNQRAETFLSTGEYDSSKYYYRKAMYENPESTELLFAYGNILLNESDYDSAIVYYDRVMLTDPEYDDARYNKALALYYLKNFEQARQELRRLSEKNPDYNDANLLMGDTYYEEKNFESAIQSYETAYSNGARSANLCHVMAYIYDQKNNSEKAISLYQETLYYDSARADIYTRLAELIPAEASEYVRLGNQFRQE